MGAYQADSEDQALELMAKDAGYDSYAEACEVVAEGDFTVTEAVTLNGDTHEMEAVVSLMDDDIREKLHAEMAPCTDQQFVDAYIKAHEEKHGENFDIN